MWVLGISKDEISEQVTRILAHESFAAGPRRTKLLRYLIDRTLAGEQSRLKGYAIGVDVFDRDDDFNPQSESIVRV